MSNSRIERRKNTEQQKRMKKRRRKRSPFKLGLFVLTCLLALIGYGIFEYYTGYMEAAGDITLPGENKEAFKGAENLDKVNVLILGVDTSDNAAGRTDTIMVAQYDPKSGRAKIASIMRDSYVSIPGYKNNKINSAYFFGGAELVRQTIKENFDIDVEYYATVNFDGFAKVVDVFAPDGVNIDVEKRMYYTDNAGGLFINFQPGVQKLDGAELLKYARFRHDAESDFGRVRRQQQVISAVKDEMISIKGVTKLPKMLGTVQPYVDTNLSPTTILGLGTSFLKNSKDIETIRIPVDDSYSDGSYSHAGSVLEMDIEQNRQALDDFFNSTEATDIATNDVKDDITE